MARRLRKVPHLPQSFKIFAVRAARIAALLAFAGLAACTREKAPSDNTRCALAIVNRVRLFPAPDRAAQMANGTVMGSASSPTNGFVDLATIAAAPAAGMFTELTFPNATPYRYVKYYGASGSYGVIAEIEFYAGTERLSGAPFGVAGSRDNGGNTYEKALDGDTSTFFEGPLPDGDYVGLDLGAGHEALSPVFQPVAGQYDRPPAVLLSTDTAGASILYTTDGTDPTKAGRLYTGPIQIGTGTTTIKAVTSASCLLDSEVTQATYRVGSGPTPVDQQSSIHIGNSLTDTIVGRLDVLAQSAGVTLDFHRFTIPGAGTQWLWNNPTAGFGETDIKSSLQTIHFDQMSVQPFPNEPCYPAGDGSDADYVNRFYALAKQVNPNILLWIYQQWPTPQTWNDCFSMGAAWTNPPWIPPIPKPATWDDAVSNQLSYQEAVRKGVMDLNPGTSVYIIPGGLALRDLKKEVEAGHVSGWSNFATSVFDQGGTDIHLTAPGRWFITLVFYACMFRQSPVGVPYDDTGLNADQAAMLEQVVWNTVNSYPLSGISR